MENTKELRDFYSREWQKAKKEGKMIYSSRMKEYYKDLVLDHLSEPYNEYHESLKQFPMLMLN